MMRYILGIDPGLAATGYGLISVERGRLAWIDHGVIRTGTDLSPGARLSRIFDSITDFATRQRPEIAGVESLYFSKNATSALPVAQARGVVLLALHRLGIEAREFSPAQIKQAVVGEGGADKEQVAQLVRIGLGMNEAPRPDHAADALAVAITRANWIESSFTERARVQ
jgi:crossover junction endodeoxyribonuclease RuvC